MAGGTTFDTDFATATADKYIAASVRDQIFNEAGLLGWLERKVGVDRVSGGDNILVPINTAKNSQGSSYSGYDTFDTDPQDTLTNAVFSWKQYQKPIVAQTFEVFRNSGTEQKVNMWAEKAKLALRSLRDDLNIDAFAASVGNSGKNIQGIGLLVDSGGTVGGINRSTATYWQANETAASGALAIDTSVGMLRMFNNCATGSGDSATPDAIWTDQDEYEAYQNLLSPDIRYTSRQQGDGTFSGLAFNGAPLMWDAACTAGVMFFLNSRSFGMHIHPQRDFKVTEIAKADNGTLNQDAWVSHILVWPELWIAEPRRNGKLTGLTD